jgi:hypothetical protein
LIELMMCWLMPMRRAVRSKRVSQGLHFLVESLGCRLAELKS